MSESTTTTATTTTPPTPPPTTTMDHHPLQALLDEVYNLLPKKSTGSDENQKKRVIIQQLVQDVLDQGANVRAFFAESARKTQGQVKGTKVKLLRQRHELYQRLKQQQQQKKKNQSSSSSSLDEELPILHNIRRISKQLRHNNNNNGFSSSPWTMSHPPNQEQQQQQQQQQQAQAGLASISEKLQALQQLVGLAELQELPWRLRFVADVDPLSLEPIVFGGDNDDDGGSAILNQKGELVWADHCATCHWEIDPHAPRWHCLTCPSASSVQCNDCHSSVFGQLEHGQSCCPSWGLVLEHNHAVLARVETIVEGSLTRTLWNMFTHAWPNRPCFYETTGAMVATSTINDNKERQQQQQQQQQQQHWWTYRQVWQEVSRICNLLLDLQAKELLLLFPAGSMEFYLFDLGAALAGVPTIGYPTPTYSSSPRTNKDENDEYSCFEQQLPVTSHAACDESLRDILRLPASCQLIHRQEAQLYPALDKVPLGGSDDPDALYTTYYTSGSTGKPKAIPCTRREFMKTVLVSRGTGPLCTLSFRPPCWAGDRDLVYRILFNGGRVGFSRPSPSLQDIIEDVAEIEPTVLSLPPVLMQFLNTVDPPANLGKRLEHISTGSAPVGPTTMRAVEETYGIEVAESYGTTEIGGIASKGRVLPELRKSIRLKDPVTQEWLAVDDKKAPVVGELWVGDHNTQDLVELSQYGTHLKVLGRSSGASSFKASNGKWCSLVDIEDQIVRACYPYIIEAFVFETKPGFLTLVARTNSGVDSMDGDDKARTLLRKVHERVAVSSEMQPKSIIVTNDEFPKTNTLKIKRGVLAQKYRHLAKDAHMDECRPGDCADDVIVDTVRIAMRVLGHPVDGDKSFFENGGDSMTGVKWLYELKVHRLSSTVGTDWRSLMTNPLSSFESVMDDSPATGAGVLPPRSIFNNSPHATDISSVPYSCDEVCFETPPTPSNDARHVLLTGATGFLGRHVLKELLQYDDSTIVVCLVRKESLEKLTSSDRIVVVTRVPLDIEYKKIYHLAAQVNHVLDYNSLKTSNVDLTEHLLRLRIAPMVYCSTSSTQNREPPFRDGYTQTKWVSECMVNRSGGTCVHPPFLLWGNKRDWFTRLVKHCVRTGLFPVELGFLTCAPVELTAREIVAKNGPCSSFQLSLKDFFLVARRFVNLRPVPLRLFVADVRQDPSSSAFSVLPLLMDRQMVGNSSEPDLMPLHLKENDVLQLLQALQS